MLSSSMPYNNTTLTLKSHQRPSEQEGRVEKAAVPRGTYRRGQLWYRYCSVYVVLDTLEACVKQGLIYVVQILVIIMEHVWMKWPHSVVTVLKGTVEVYVSMKLTHACPTPVLIMEHVLTHLEDIVVCAHRITLGLSVST